MIKRTIEISQQPVHLTVENEQLLLLRRDDERSLLSSVPCEDLGMLLVEEQGVTYSHAALTTLLRHGAALVVCGRDHLPAGMLMPFADHTEVVTRLHLQLEAHRPLRKQLWRQIVRAKIRAQAANLPPGTAARTRLLELARNVRSGDPENAESQAAQAYWRAWLDGVAAAELDLGPFRRDADRPGINALLNYGYAVLRAAMARALVAAGLQPALGLHHRNRSNPFCLADDLMEPLRPLVDARVRELLRTGETELRPLAKRGLLELLTAPLQVGELCGPLMVALHRYTASFVRCLAGESRVLEVPLAAGQESADENA